MTRTLNYFASENLLYNSGIYIRKQRLMTNVTTKILKSKNCSIGVFVKCIEQDEFLKGCVNIVRNQMLDQSHICFLKNVHDVRIDQ